MGKKTKEEKIKIRTNLDLLMHLPAEITNRNPRIMALYKDISLGQQVPQEIHEIENKIIKETYGTLPSFPFPVLDMIKIKNKPNELFLRIDLNYSKDEIMYVLEKFIDSKVDEYRKNHKIKIKRKQPEKWITYLQIWDLKNGYPPPSGRDLSSRLNAILFRDFGNKGRSWTYEEIAKYIYPDTTTPEKLISAIDKVKKQYRAAYNLICGEKYNTLKAEAQIEQIRQQNKIVTCDSCPEKLHCETLCPPMAEDLANLEVKRQGWVVFRDISTSKSIDQ